VTCCIPIRSGSPPSVSVIVRPEYAAIVSSECTAASSRTSSGDSAARRPVSSCRPAIVTSRAASGNGGGRRNITSKTENIVVFVAIASARHITATAVKSRPAVSVRTA
jgi:hypothetical protein